MHVINKETSKDKSLMSLVRRLVTHFNILFQAQHIQGLNNVLADHLSRQQISQFLQKCPHRNPIFYPINEASLMISEALRLI
jgi:hypothetical protein